MAELTLEEQTGTLAGYLPNGRAFGAKVVSGSGARQLLEGLAGELIRADALVEEFRVEILPDETVLFLDEWESAVGIPDDCFEASGTDDERRRDILAKLAALGVQTAPDFVAVAGLFGVDIIISGGSLHGTFPYVFPMIFFPDAKTARFTIVVDFILPAAQKFTYTFPITFTEPTNTLVECLFLKLKPANVDILFINLPN